MKVAHLTIIAPHRTGLYGTARDLVAAERALGADARLVHPLKPKKGMVHGVPVDGHQWAASADAWVNHSGFDGSLDPGSRPVIHILHGRPYSSYLLGLAGKGVIYDYIQNKACDPHFKAFVTLWPDFLPYWRHLIPNGKLTALNAPVDLKEWSPDGPAGYAFHGKKAPINVVIADRWREDMNPHAAIHAFGVYARTRPEARLHIYAAPIKKKGFNSILRPLAARGNLGEVMGIVKGLAHVFRAADAVITPHRIATRIVREALACGTQVVMADGNPYTPYTADPFDIERFAEQIDRAVTDWQENRDGRKQENRTAAETHFDSAATARDMLRIIEDHA